VKDEDVAEQAAALALADPPPDKGPEVVALSAKVKTLETERDTIKAEAETLKLSAAAPKEPDALSLSLITRAFKTDRERVIESGVVSEAGMKEIDALLLARRPARAVRARPLRRQPRPAVLAAVRRAPPAPRRQDGRQGEAGGRLARGRPEPPELRPGRQGARAADHARAAHGTARARRRAPAAK
jgi:hypothetical protein